MNQKQVSVLLFACLVIVSFMCYQQAKKIDNMEWEISHLDDKVDTLEEKIKDLENEIEEIKQSVESLQEEMEEHFPTPRKSYAQQRKEDIERIKRFNAAREEEEKQGIVNTDPKVELERKWLQAVKKTMHLDIEIK